MEDLKVLTQSIDELLASVDFSDVSADQTQKFEDLPDGYYLNKMESYELTTSKSSGCPMFAFKFRVEQNGVAGIVDDSGNFIMKEVKNSANRIIFKYYPLKDEKSLKTFISDMLKFEENEENQATLKEAFESKSTELIMMAIDALVGRYVYIQISTTDKGDGNKSTWQNLISWKRASILELPV